MYCLEIKSPLFGIGAIREYKKELAFHFTGTQEI